MILPYRLASKLFHLLPLPPGKTAESRAGRLAATARWMQWGRDSRSDHQLVWFHAASVGETQVIAPLITRFGDRSPAVQTVLTYSSPSMATWPHDTGAHREDFAPAELPRAMAGVFDTLRPSLIVVSRGDLWPEMLHAAGMRGVPVAVVGGTIRANSYRLSRPARAIAKGLYRNLGFVGAVSHDDAARWLRVGVPPHAVTVTGDPRNDYVLERTPNASTLRPFAAWAAGGDVMVAGSTHPTDEDVLVHAFASVRSRLPGARLMIVPHEPSRGATERIHRLARSLGLHAARWSGSTEDVDSSILVVSDVGLLADLYALGTLAYVGGGFGPTGTHSWLEPAACGVPVLTGPEATRNAAMRSFIQCGGVTAIEGPAPSESLATEWTALLTDADRRLAAGQAARDQITRGAAAESMQALDVLLVTGGSRGAGTTE